MSKTLIRGARIWDGSGAEPTNGDLLINGDRIEAVGSGLSAEGCEVIDAQGMFLMPGMTEGHGHLSFDNVTATEDLIKPGVEEHTLLTARVAERLLDQGFTSVWGASEAKLRLGVAVRNEIEAGNLKGPRIRAGSLEISVTGAMGDESRLHDPRPGGPSHIVDGPEEMRKAVRLACREGCDNIKLDVSGDPFYPGTPANTTPMSYEEVKMAVDTAHSFGKRVNAHVRSIAGAKVCLKAGVDALFHCEFTDEEALDMFEEAKDRVYVVPTVSLFHTLLYEAEPYMSADVARMMGIDRLLEASQETHTALRKRGIKHVIGGDFGFAWSPNGTNARDIEFFVKYYGYSPAEALVCATANGGAMMTMGTDEKLGLLKEGYLADMLLVNGDPLTDTAAVVDANNLKLIMKGGVVHKNTTAA
ncbi:amidohydrolase family protein [Spongiibacter nanhainus]|uniref:Amidohydrolase family protein n=1 Tax=Spongiibacter nanhainus TaxID=2794344 RepID=A0A7T4R3J5_9GAMM|nr:amidohydrolase family protein [Spongiibacter nanhainus]QQD19512.1 amidohydrolase family protein [Spongiibacter nanhainus]